MTEVHRYKVVTMLSAAGATIGYDPHGPDVVMASAFDEASRLFLDAAERCVAAERREKELQQRLTAADERVDTAISLLECVLDTGELTREKHLDLEADICRLVTDFWGDRKSARIPSPPRCPDCGYTEQDCREQMDHHLCGSPEPAPARNP